MSALEAKFDTSDALKQSIDNIRKEKTLKLRLVRLKRQAMLERERSEEIKKKMRKAKLRMAMVGK